MRRLNLLIVMTAMVFVAAGSAKGNSTLGPVRLDRAAVTASGQFSFPTMESGRSLSGTILPASQESTVAQLFVAATAEDGDKNPPPRSKHCPPDKDDHHNSIQKSGDNQNQDNQDKDKDKDKDHHDKCGKGDDDKNP
jgi:hypothetical protein